MALFQEKHIGDPFLYRLGSVGTRTAVWFLRTVFTLQILTRALAGPYSACSVPTVQARAAWLIPSPLRGKSLSLPASILLTLVSPISDTCQDGKHTLLEAGLTGGRDTGRSE